MVDVRDFRLPGLTDAQIIANAYAALPSGNYMEIGRASCRERV